MGPGGHGIRDRSSGAVATSVCIIPNPFRGKGGPQSATTLRCRADQQFVTHGGGHPGQTLVVLDDTTQQRQLEQQVNQAERVAALGEMAAGVAHQIRNPLAIMQNVCDLLKRLKPGQRKEQNHTIDILQTHIHRVNDRITGLLDFARPGRRDAESVDVVAVLRDVLDLEGSRVQAADIDVQTHLQHVPCVRVGREALRDILANLVANALDAMPEGGTLTVSTLEAEDQVLVRISDTGVGIPQQQLARIFEPFYSTKPAGFGLGLSMSRRQVDDAGGRIEVQSREAHGSTFSVYLPAVVERVETP